MNRFSKYLFKRWKKYQPCNRGLYAVTKGTFIGEFFVFMETLPEHYRILSLPDFKLRKIEKKFIIEAIKRDILDLVKILPKTAYYTCKSEYMHRIATGQKDEPIN